MSDKYAVIGHPIGHSMSPFIHKRLFGLSGKKDVEYSSADIAPEDLESSIPPAVPAFGLQYNHSAQGSHDEISCGHRRLGEAVRCRKLRKMRKRANVRLQYRRIRL